MTIRCNGLMQISKKRPGYNREHMMAKKMKISSFIFIWECLSCLHFCITVGSRTSQSKRPRIWKTGRKALSYKITLAKV